MIIQLMRGRLAKMMGTILHWPEFPFLWTQGALVTPQNTSAAIPLRPNTSRVAMMLMGSTKNGSCTLQLHDYARHMCMVTFSSSIRLLRCKRA